MKRRGISFDLLVAHCCDYAGDPVQRAWLLPRVLRQLGYDVGGWLRLGPGERVFARHPGDSEFLQAPELLDDLQAARVVTPEPFELVGSEASLIDNPRIVWAARVRGVGTFQHGQQPASTLIAALLTYTRHQRPRLSPPMLPIAYPASVVF